MTDDAVLIRIGSDYKTGKLWRDMIREQREVSDPSTVTHDDFAQLVNSRLRCGPVRAGHYCSMHGG